MSGALLVALVAPLTGAFGRRLLAPGAAVATTAWAAVAVGGGATLGRFAPGPPAAAVAAGTCAVAAATAAGWREPGPAAAHALALWATVAGVAAGYGDPSFLPVVAGLGVAAAALAAGAWLAGDGGLAPAAGAALGAAACGVGIRLVHAETGSWALLGSEVRTVTDWVPAWLLGGASLVAAAGALRAGSPGALVGGPGLAVAVSAAVIPGGSVRVAAAYAAVAVVVAAAGAAGRLPMRVADPAALGALAVAAAVVGSGPGAWRPPAMLLAAGAVIAMALPGRGAALAGLPGAAALVPSLVRTGGPGAWVVGCAAAACLGLLAYGAVRRAAPLRPTGSSVPALAAAGWLVVAPGSWGWVGPHEMPAYDRGAAVAVAAGLVGLVSGCLAGLVPVPAPRTAWSPEGGADPAWAGPAALGALAVLGAVAAWLVASAVGSR